MGKAVRIGENHRLAKALAEGAEYLVVGRRRFRLIEVEADDQMDGDFYEPSDAGGIQALEEALRDDSRLLDADEGRKFLKERLRENGIS